MRVLLLNQYYAPDEAATAQLLADVGGGLVQAGYQVTAVCSARSYADPSRSHPRRETLDGVDVLRARGSGFGRESSFGRLIDYATFVVGAAGLVVRAPRPDVVISLSTPPMIAALGWLVSRVRGARSLYWVMDIYPELAYELGVLRRGSVGGRLLERVSRFLVRRSDRVVALGEWMAERLSAAGGRVVVVHNWADGSAIRPRRPEDDHPLRRRWGWHGRFVIMYSGNMGLAHEFDTVLGAAELLRSEPEMLFAFVGGGPRRRAVEAEAARRGLPNVEFRPYVARAELGQSLAAPDLHLVTLRPRVQGLLVPSKIYGILAAGVPTVYVGPPEGEIPEILAAGACGTSVTDGRPESVAAAILAYRSDPEKARDDGRRARSLFEERFTRERGVATFIDLVRGVAA